MKKSFKAAAINSIFALMFFAAATCPAQTPPPIAGAYREIAKTDATVVAAANFAVKTQAAADAAKLQLVAINSAKRQIVAGSNYELCLTVTAAGRSQQAIAVVYYDLENRFSLTSWTPGRCSKGAAASSPRTAKPAATTTALAPDVVVKNLYAAQQSGEGAPFFQNTDRAAVDRFFTKDFADLIWQDAVAADGEVGVLGADPLFDAQDAEITRFKVGAPRYGDAGSAGEDTATVEVSFRNFRRPEAIRFILERDGARAWKISDIRYRNGDMLKGRYAAAQRDAANGATDEPAPADASFEGSYKVGATTCDVKPIKMAFEVRCSNRKAVEYFFPVSDFDPARPAFTNENKNRKFAFDDRTLSSGTFTDAAGRTANISRVR